MSIAGAAVYAAFCDPAGVPPGWCWVNEPEEGGFWALDHTESGLRLEVFPPPPPSDQNRPSWQVRDPKSDRVLAYNVAEDRAAAFVASVPQRARAPRGRA